MNDTALSPISVSLAQIEAFAISVPLKAPVKMAGIVVTSADNLIVCARDASGREGWGEASSAPTMTGELPEAMVAAARYLAPSLQGVTLSGVTSIGPALDRTLYGNHGAKAAIEMAILDLMARTAGLPLCHLLGGAVREKAAVLTMVAGGDPQAEVANARAAQEAGFTAFKVKVGVNAPAVDLARCRMIRDALGPNAQISGDANQGFSREEAIAFARGAEAAGLDFMEQLTDGHDLAGMAAAAAATPVPLGADEGIHSLADITAHHEAGAARGGSLKTIKLGGLLPVMVAGRLMDRLGMAVNLAGKVAETSIASAAIAHAAASLPRIDWGTSITNQYLADDVVDTPLAIRHGHVCPPAGAGLGVLPDRAKLDRYTMRI